MSNLCFRYSSMNAGKSTALLQAAYNYEEQGRAIEVYTAAIDDRYGVGRVTSRLGISRDAKMYDADVDFTVALADLQVACVFIDEAEFLPPAQVTQLHRFAHDRGIPVVCYGLRTDFKGNPFEGSAYLLSLADDLEELKTTCACSGKATMNVRINKAGKRVRSGALIEIGGNLNYRQVCATCFYAERD